MKSILIVCLCMWGLLVYGEKNNTVHLYGSLKEFKAAEVNMAPDGAAGEISSDKNTRGRRWKFRFGVAFEQTCLFPYRTKYLVSDSRR